MRVPRQRELEVASFSRPKEGALLGRVVSSGEAAAVAAAGPSAGVVASKVVSGKRNASELPLAAVSGQRPSALLSAPARFGLIDQLPIDTTRVGGAGAYLGALLKGADGTRKVRGELEVRYLAEAAFTGRAGPKSLNPEAEVADVALAMNMHPRMTTTRRREQLGGRGKDGAEGGFRWWRRAGGRDEKVI